MNDKLVAKFRNELNRINSETNKKITQSSIDMNLTKATNLFVQEMIRYSSFNPTAAHYISQLIVPKKEIKSFENITEHSVFAKFPEDLIKDISIVCYAKLGDTESEIKLIPVQDDEFDVLKNDPVWGPNFNFRETIYRYTNGGIEIATNKKFEIVKLVLDYYKKHPDITSPGLSTDGYYYLGEQQITNDSPLLLTNSNQDDIIVSFAVLYTTVDIVDGATFQMKKDEIFNSNNLVKSKIS